MTRSQLKGVNRCFLLRKNPTHFFEMRPKDVCLVLFLIMKIMIYISILNF